MNLAGPVSIDYLELDDGRLFIILGDVHFSKQGSDCHQPITVPQFVSHLTHYATVNLYLEAPTNINKDYVNLIKEHYHEHYDYFINNCQKDFLNDCTESINTDSKVKYTLIDIRNDPYLMDPDILTKIKFIHFSQIIFSLNPGINKSEINNIFTKEITDYFLQNHSITVKDPFTKRFGYHLHIKTSILLNFYHHACSGSIFENLFQDIELPTLAHRLKINLILSNQAKEIAALPFSISNLVYTLTRICDCYTFLHMLKDKSRINVYYGGKAHSDRIISMLKQFYSLTHKQEPAKMDQRCHQLSLLPTLLN